MLRSEEIIEVLSPLNFWGKGQEVGIERTSYLQKMQEYLGGKDVVLSVIGVRRAGKTYLTKQLLKLKAEHASLEKTLYVLLEEPKFDPYLGLNLLDEVYQAYRDYVASEGEVYLVLDEIQNVPHWEKWVRTMLEKKEKVKIIITGSSSKLLSSSLATVLTGRTITLKVYPLSFDEFLLFKGQRVEKKYELLSKRRKLEKLLLEYITYGGFPQVVSSEDPTLKISMLKEIFEGIVLRDVVARHKIRDAVLAKTVAEVSVNQFACLTSAAKTRNMMVNLIGRKVSPNLILNLLSYLEEAFLIFQIPIFSYKVKEQKLYPKKTYCIDSGIINAVTIKFQENMGRLFENIVAISLIRKFGIENIFYWKSREQEEVDFVLKKGLKIEQLIQVCYEVLDKEVEKREEKALLKAAKELNCSNLLVISRDTRKRKKVGPFEICYLPLLDWLLGNF